MAAFKPKRIAYLKDGDRKEVGPQTWSEAKTRFKVEAHRIDSETPYVILTDADGKETWLEDTYAEELARRISAALKVLPMSK